MKIHSVLDAEFKPYGKVLEGYDTTELKRVMLAIELPESGTAYRPGIESLEACDIFSELRDRAYGGMPIQLGMCWGHNTKLNCLEYHRDSEVNIGTHDFILLLAKEDEIEAGVLGVPGPGGGSGGGVRYHAALRALPHERRGRLPRSGGPASGYKYRKARDHARKRRG